MSCPQTTSALMAQGLLHLNNFSLCKLKHNQGPFMHNVTPS